MNIQPEAYSRRVLVAAVGMSPQILTETVYCLAVGSEHRFVPTEIHLITTMRGKNIADKEFVETSNGKLVALLADYGLDSSMLHNFHVHVVNSTTGEALNDIVTPEDNEQFANLASSVIGSLCADESSAVHVSIAGGRKTMGYYLGYTLSLFGRRQDRLSHVLVQPEFENLPEFYYPTPERNIIRDRNGKYSLDAKDARLMLAEIPFVPMKEILPSAFRMQTLTFSGAIGAMLDQATTASITIDVEKQTLSIGGHDVRLRGINLAFYAWILWRHKTGAGCVSLSNDEDNHSLELGREFAIFFCTFFAKDEEAARPLLMSFKLDEHYRPVSKTSGMNILYVRPILTRIKTALKKTLGENVQKKHGISITVQRTQNTTLAVEVDPASITLKGVKTKKT